MFSTLVSKVSHNSGGFVLVMFFQWWPYLVIPTTSVTNGKQCQLPGSHSPPLMSVGIIQDIVQLVKTGSSTCMRSLTWKQNPRRSCLYLIQSSPERGSFQDLVISSIFLSSQSTVTPLCLWGFPTHCFSVCYAQIMEAGVQQESTAWRQRSGREGKK